MVSLSRTVRQQAHAPRPLVFSTHHKALTVLFGRMLKVMARTTGARFSEGIGSSINWSADLILDYNSDVDRCQLPHYRGLHVVRDPRDLLVSSAFYHLRSSEPWLHKPYADFGGMTYQEKVKSLPDMEAVMLFELDHVAGNVISDMLAWDRSHPHTAELTYEALLGEGADDYLEQKLVDAHFDPHDTALLMRLFKNFSLGGPWMAGHHIRNPNPGQYMEHFHGPVRTKFNAKFPNALEQLGYVSSKCCAKAKAEKMPYTASFFEPSATL